MLFILVYLIQTSHYMAVSLCSMQVLQDIWHAKQRILRQLTKRHPDYAQARSEWNLIFTKLRTEAKGEAHPYL